MFGGHVPSYYDQTSDKIVHNTVMFMSMMKPYDVRMNQ